MDKYVSASGHKLERTSTTYFTDAILTIIHTPSATLTAGVLSKISCIHSDEMVCDHGDHSKGTKIVRQVVQRLVAYHFGSKGVGVT